MTLRIDILYRQLMMSSDKISAVQEPIVSLDFDVTSGSSEIHSFELNKDELTQLINSLEGANRVSETRFPKYR